MCARGVCVCLCRTHNAASASRAREHDWLTSSVAWSMRVEPTASQSTYPPTYLTYLVIYSFSLFLICIVYRVCIKLLYDSGRAKSVALKLPLIWI